MKFSGDLVAFFYNFDAPENSFSGIHVYWLSQVNELGLVLFALASFNGTQLGCTLVPSLASSDV